MLPAYLLQDGSVVRDWQVINDDRPKYWVSSGYSPCYSYCNCACFYNNPYIVCFKQNHKKAYSFTPGIEYSCCCYIDIYGNYKSGDGMCGACNISHCGYMICGRNVKYIAYDYMSCNRITLITDGGCVYWKCQAWNCPQFVNAYFNLIGLGDMYCQNYCKFYIDVCCDLRLFNGCHHCAAVICIQMFPNTLFENIICNNSTQSWKINNFYINSTCCPNDLKYNTSIDKNSNTWSILTPYLATCGKYMLELFEMELPILYSCSYSCSCTGIKKIWKIPKDVFWSCHNTSLSNKCANTICCQLDRVASYDDVTKACGFYIINARHCAVCNYFCIGCGCDSFSLVYYYRQSSIILNTNTNVVYGITQPCGYKPLDQEKGYVARTPIFTALTPRNTFFVISTFERCSYMYEYTCNFIPICGKCYAFCNYTVYHKPLFVYDCIEDAIIIFNYNMSNDNNNDLNIIKLPTNTDCVNNNFVCCLGTSCFNCNKYFNGVGMCPLIFTNKNDVNLPLNMPCIISYNLNNSEIICDSQNNYISMACLCALCSSCCSTRVCFCASTVYCQMLCYYMVNTYCSSEGFNILNASSGMPASICPLYGFQQPRRISYFPF